MQPPPKLTYNTEELAEILGIAVGTLRNRMHREPETLPPAIRAPRARHLLWLVSDVEAWLKQHYIPNQLKR